MIRVAIVEDAVCFLEQYHGNFEVVTMDIEMPGMNGGYVFTPFMGDYPSEQLHFIRKIGN